MALHFHLASPGKTCFTFLYAKWSLPMLSGGWAVPASCCQLDAGYQRNYNSVHINKGRIRLWRLLSISISVTENKSSQAAVKKRKTLHRTELDSKLF